ncbi:MAG: DUF2939 domain-containing protein [Burkholderiaceae bacterium]|nr:DUF2939 domain-containing protein [Burkholderiaceae bacterium]
MKKLLSTVGIGVLALAAFAYASPYFTLHQIKNSLADKDADALSEHVDFPALRENVKGQVMAMMSARMSGPEMKDNPFAAMGQALGAAMVGPMIDSMVSPAGVVALMRNSASRSSSAGETKAPNSGEQIKPNYTVSYKGWDRVTVRPAGSEAGEGTLTLRRHGLWNWKLTAIEMPSEILSK